MSKKALNHVILATKLLAKPLILVGNTSPSIIQGIGPKAETLVGIFEGFRIVLNHTITKTGFYLRKLQTTKIEIK